MGISSKKNESNNCRDNQTNIMEGVSVNCCNSDCSKLIFVYQIYCCS